MVDSDDQILPTSAFDIWLSKSAEERWFSLVVLWLDTSRASGLIGKAGDKNIAPLGPELDRAGVSLIRRTTLKVLLENPQISPEISSMQEIIKWWNPQRANNEFVEWNLRETEWLGITGQGVISVVVALSRAFNGNFASLGKLQTSYTTAQLQTMGFNDAEAH